MTFFLRSVTHIARAKVIGTIRIVVLVDGELFETEDPRADDGGRIRIEDEMDGHDATGEVANHDLDGMPGPFGEPRIGVSVIPPVDHGLRCGDCQGAALG